MGGLLSFLSNAYASSETMYKTLKDQQRALLERQNAVQESAWMTQLLGQQGQMAPGRMQTIYGERYPHSPYGQEPQPPPPKPPETALQWLDRRVNEIRVRL